MPSPSSPPTMLKPRPVEPFDNTTDRGVLLQKQNKKRASITQRHRHGSEDCTDESSHRKLALVSSEQNIVSDITETRPNVILNVSTRIQSHSKRIVSGKNITLPQLESRKDQFDVAHLGRSKEQKKPNPNRDWNIDWNPRAGGHADIVSSLSAKKPTDDAVCRRKRKGDIDQRRPHSLRRQTRYPPFGQLRLPSVRIRRSVKDGRKETRFRPNDTSQRAKQSRGCCVAKRKTNRWHQAPARQNPSPLPPNPPLCELSPPQSIKKKFSRKCSSRFRFVFPYSIDCRKNIQKREASGFASRSLLVRSHYI